jgi:hypothetical protein
MRSRSCEAARRARRRLSGDGVRPGALKEVEAETHIILDTYATRYAKQLETAVFEVWAVRGQAARQPQGCHSWCTRTSLNELTTGAIRVAFDDARKAFGADIAQSYVNHRAVPTMKRTTTCAMPT